MEVPWNVTWYNGPLCEVVLAFNSVRICSVSRCRPAPGSLSLHGGSVAPAKLRQENCFPWWAALWTQRRRDAFVNHPSAYSLKTGWAILCNIALKIIMLKILVWRSFLVTQTSSPQLFLTTWLYSRNLTFEMEYKKSWDTVKSSMQINLET